VTEIGYDPRSSTISLSTQTRTSKHVILTRGGGGGGVAVAMEE